MHLVWFIVAHILADQMFQSAYMRRNKGENLYIFFTHISIHAIFMALTSFLLFPEYPIVAALIFFIDIAWHSIVDKTTYTLYCWSVAWRNKEKSSLELRKTWHWGYDEHMYKFMAAENIAHIAGISIVFYYLCSSLV
jgi:hypothetical protein